MTSTDQEDEIKRLRGTIAHLVAIARLAVHEGHATPYVERLVKQAVDKPSLEYLDQSKRTAALLRKAADNLNLYLASPEGDEFVRELRAEADRIDP